MYYWNVHYEIKSNFFVKLNTILFLNSYASHLFVFNVLVSRDCMFARTQELGKMFKKQINDVY